MKRQRTPADGRNHRNCCDMLDRLDTNRQLLVALLIDGLTGLVLHNPCWLLQGALGGQLQRFAAA